jgi:hypothetical protein
MRTVGGRRFEGCGQLIVQAVGIVALIEHGAEIK